jgi:Holliday junction resolvase
MKNSRRKGSVAEREIASLLQEWWRRVEPDCKFVRVPLSGGWSTANVRGELRASGDVMTTSTTFPFCVEVKRREGWSFDRMKQGMKSPVWEWWRQAQTQAAEQRESGHRVYPLLFIRQSRMEWFVLVPWSVVQEYFFPLIHLFHCIKTRDGVDAGEERPALIAATAWFAFEPHRFYAVNTDGDTTNQETNQEPRDTI